MQLSTAVVIGALKVKEQQIYVFLGRNHKLGTVSYTKILGWRFVLNTKI